MDDDERTGRAGAARNNTTIWDELQEEPLLEPSEPVEITRGFFRTLFGTFYDRLGALILINLLVVVQVCAGVALGLLIAVPFTRTAALWVFLVAAATWLVSAPAVAGLFTYVRAICDPDALSTIRDYWRGQRRYGRRALVLLAIQAVSGALLWLNLRFYVSVHGPAGLVLVMIILLLTLLWAMAGMYAWPLLVRDLRWPLLFRNALYLALAAPFSTVAMLAGLLAVSAVCALTRVGVAILVFVAWALTENVALARLIRMFNARQAPEAEEVASG